MKKYIFTLLLLSSFRLCSQNVIELWHKADSVHQIGDREASIEFFLKAEQVMLKDSINNLHALAENNNRLGLRYQNYGEWDLSAFTYTKGLEQINDCNDCDSIKSNLLLNLGLLYVKLRMPEKLFYLEEAKRVAKKSNIERVLFIYYKVVEGKLDEGIKFAKRINNNQYLSNYYYLKGRLDEFRYFDSARAVLPPIDDAVLQNFQYHVFLADHYFEDWNADSMYYHLVKASIVAPKLNDNEVDNHLSEVYARYYLQLGETDSAIYYMSISDSIRHDFESLAHREVLSKLDANRVNYENQLEIINLKSKSRVLQLGLISILLLLIVVAYFVVRLRNINKKLVSANETKAKLFSVLSHDFKTPLVGLKQVLTKEDSDKSVVLKNIDSLLEEFDSLMVWSLSHQNKISYNPKQIDLSEYVNETIKVLKPLQIAKNIDYSIINEQECSVYVDEDMLLVCLRNILTNALKYTNNNTQISIEYGEQKDYFVISIRNKIAFSQDSGKGIGLDLVKQFAKLNNVIYDYSKDKGIYSAYLYFPKS